MQFANKNFVRIAQLLNDRKRAEEIIEYGQATYKLQKNQLKLITTTFILDYFQKQQKYNSDTTTQKALQTQKGEQNWHPNQLKIFTWALLAYAHLQHKSLPEFTEEDILAINKLFPTKALNFIRYHHQYFSKSAGKQNRCEWKEEEVRLLTDIIQSNQFDRKWSDIAYELYCRSALAFFKTSHQCREKWFNHLNPALSKEKWTIDEDIELFRNARDLGTKWAKISKAMGEYRTEHMIKNRFKSIAKKYENRYQRCTMRKRIENILKDLELKRITLKEKQILQNTQNEMKSEECLANSKTSEKEEEIIKSDIEVEGEANPITPATDLHVQCLPQLSFNKISPTVFEDVEYEYAQEKYDFVYDEGIIINLRQNPNHSDIMLIDYLHMDFEARNKTIFSGSVE